MLILTCMCIGTYIPIFTGHKSPTFLFAFMNYLHTYGGYYLIDRHDNKYCSQCTEIILAKLQSKTNGHGESRYNKGSNSTGTSTGHNSYHHLNKQSSSELQLVIDAVLN